MQTLTLIIKFHLLAKKLLAHSLFQNIRAKKQEADLPVQANLSAMPLKPDVLLESGPHHDILNSFFVPQTHTPTRGLPWIFRLTRKTHPTHYAQKKQGSLRNICREELLWPDQIHIDVMIGCGTPIPAKIPDHAIMLQGTPAFLVMINARCTFDCSM